MVKSTLFAELETLGEPAVRNMLAMGNAGAVGTDHRLAVESWLESKVRERAEASASRRDAREEESLSISRKALRNSERATRIAISAIILSISMAIVAIIQWYSK